MISSRNLCLAVSVVSLVFLAGCFLEKEKGRERAQLVAGAAVPSTMNKWVAVSPEEPKAVTHSELGITYHVLATHHLVPAKMDGFKALSPALFERYTQIKIQLPADRPMWTMKEGKKVTPEMNGWVGLPLSYPNIQREAKYGLAVLREDQIIPKEMNGWVVVDTDTLVKLAGDNARQGRTISGEKPIKTQPLKTRPLNKDLMKK